MRHLGMNFTRNKSVLIGRVPDVENVTSGRLSPPVGGEPLGLQISPGTTAVPLQLEA